MSPKNASLYHENLKKYTDRIKALNTHITEKLLPYRKKGVIVSHPFLGYLCHDYNMYQIAVECEGKSPRAQSVNHVITLAKNYDAQCVFTSPQYNNKGALLVAEKLSLKTFEADPLDLDPLQTIQKLSMTSQAQNKPSPVISFRNVTFTYDKAPTIKHASFDVFPGEFIGIIGPMEGAKPQL